MSSLGRTDPEINDAINREGERQRETINLIASENYVSRAVMEAQGSFLTNKYAEGYPRHRLYGGCENMDAIEDAAVRRACQLFHAEHANVQPHSGTQADMAAYFALLEPGDTVMGMSLAHGGHIAHGDKSSFSGKLYNFVHYGVSRETEMLDYDDIERLAREHRPKVIVAGTSFYPRTIDFGRFRGIAGGVGAKLMVDMAHIAGTVAAGLHPSPVPHADVVTSTTHKTLRGPRSGFILCRQGLTSAIDAAVFPQMQGGPLMHVIAAKAVAFREAQQPAFAEYQRAILGNARALADGLEGLGLRLVTGGVDGHLIMADITATGVSGGRAADALGEAGIVVNRIPIPFDPLFPQDASGIRLGTPAVTTRGFGAAEMERIAALIAEVINHAGDGGVIKRVRDEVRGMCRHFPIPDMDG